MPPAARRPALLVPILLILLGAAGLAVIAAQVVPHQDQAWVLQLDHRVRDEARLLAGEPAARRAAVVVSRLTGEGLLVAVVAGALGLVWLRRRRDALILVVGTLTAWALTALLKLAFAVPRPHPGRPAHAITGYGFPSGHTLVVVVAGGLAAWLGSRHASTAVRLLLAAAVAVLAAVTGAARVLLNAHWLSDVTAGVAVGVLWLGVVLLTAGTRESPAS